MAARRRGAPFPADLASRVHRIRARTPRRAAALPASAAVCALAWSAAAGAQESAADSADHAGHAPHAAAPRAMLGAQAIGMVTRAAPALDGRTLVEGYLTQPVIMAHAAPAGGRLRLVGTIDFEGLTLRRGQLNAGAYGEGFVDRRHPHTLVHQAIASVQGAVPGARGVRASLAAGKGFVAFGTDDPMMRPFALFPVNHHLAQILERAVVVGGVRASRAAGSATLEGSLFNGDEPWSPWSWPRLGRFGDSWAVRATLAPSLASAGAPLELQASHARLTSPENPEGGGLDQRKSSLSARWASRGGGTYALVEWARTDEHRGARRAFRYQSVLAEGSARVRGVELAARAERTGRPEEERLLDLFRTVRPHLEQNVLGITEWRTVTVSAAVPLRPRGRLARAGARAAPFVEVARMAPRDVVRPSAFEPFLFYGARTLWSVNAGVRLGIGGHAMRMGRYGVLDEPAPVARPSPHAAPPVASPSAASSSSPSHRPAHTSP